MEEERGSPLDGLLVLELAGGIPVGYCGKLLADAGADVVRVGGAPAPADGTDALAALRHGYLHCSKATVTSESASGLWRSASVVLAELPDASEQLRAVEAELRRQRRPTVLLVVSAFGREGPRSTLPATEFTLQALCGSTGFRGAPEGPPLAVGGGVGDYLAGAWGAVAALAAWRRAVRDDCCEVVDLSRLEAMIHTMQAHEWLHAALMGLPTVSRSLEVPSVETAKDGYVGFTIMTPAQWSAFSRMIGRPELAEDPELSHTLGRWVRRADVHAAIDPWLAERTVREIVELSAQFRVPATMVGNGATIGDFDHFRARGVFVTRPDGARQPRPPWIIDGCRPRPLGNIPADPAGADGDARDDGIAAGRAPKPSPADQLPLAGIRVVDLTAFLAGPALTGILAALGADVVKVESVSRPDGLRLVVGPRLAEPQGWEYSWAYHGCNVNKRAVTLDLGQESGRDLLLRLVETADVLVENFAPRVLPNWGLDWELLHQRNRTLIAVRMPAYGLDGPWRDRTGFAQTMEMLSGMAWVTGQPDGPPVLPRGPCDLAAAVHGAFAVLAALRDRDRRGHGTLVELPMIEVALNLTAEQVLAHQLLGMLLERQGNRGAGAPQNLYRCRGGDAWVALAVESDAQWEALRHAIGDPAWAHAPELEHPAGRRRLHDLLDERLGEWFADHDAEDVAGLLCERGVPAAAVVAPCDVVRDPQLQARRFFEEMVHPVTGPNPYSGLPVRLERGPGRWNRTPPPTFGQHNEEILLGELGLAPSDWERLRADDVIGETPKVG